MTPSKPSMTLAEFQALSVEEHRVMRLSPETREQYGALFAQALAENLMRNVRAQESRYEALRAAQAPNSTSAG